MGQGGSVPRSLRFLTRFQIPNWQKVTGTRNKPPHLFASFSAKGWLNQQKLRNHTVSSLEKKNASKSAQFFS